MAVTSPSTIWSTVPRAVATTVLMIEIAMSIAAFQTEARNPRTPLPSANVSASRNDCRMLLAQFATSVQKFPVAA